jgi:hypothetical protein
LPEFARRRIKIKIAELNREQRLLHMNRKEILVRHIKLLTWLIIIGLVLSGITAIPLQSEANLLASFLGTKS